MQLEEWLDDLCVRFIINLPREETTLTERICFQVEEAQWFYEDFIRPIDPSLPSLPLKAFSLRIFQHCPLFQGWDQQHYVDAFAQFMAYKSRVPVRGAIMLNDAMDEVVLVKGWKKGANWSFPRGKINQNESDLDCAVREVYEETGFDIASAGLVKKEEDMKSIEITMREQHMKLFVFRGVPQDTHFEPKTRKEISKIEWYKLNDLPTLKKHRHQDSNGNEVGSVNANKFYMVAPFLNPLKKWIIQQKRNDARYSSNLSIPQANAEEILTEEEQEVRPDPPVAQPSDLPEVTISRPTTTFDDATTRLKEHLYQMQASQPVRGLPPHQVDVEKSNALLSLLRGGQAAELRTGPTTPLEQSTFPQNAPQSPQQSHLRQTPTVQQQPPPSFGLVAPNHDPSTEIERPMLDVRRQQGLNQSDFQSEVSVHERHHPSQHHAPQAPYYRTGDPVFGRSQALDSHQQTYHVPPASALPVLTTHTRNLLDVLKGEAPSSRPQPEAPQPAATQSQMLLSMLRHGSPLPSNPSTSAEEHKQHLLAALTSQSRPQALSSLGQRDKQQPRPSVEMPADTPMLAIPAVTSIPQQIEPPTRSVSQSTTFSRDDRSSIPTALLNLLRSTPNLAALSNTAPTIPRKATPPVELAAIPISQAQPKEDQSLRSFPPQSLANERRRREPQTQEGSTSATISGPLNQPHFEGVVSSQRRTLKAAPRSPLTVPRTLFDPNAPTPIKILSRPQSAKQQSPISSPRVTPQRSPKPSTTTLAAKSNTRSADASKPFHPQILKRPQTAELQEQNLQTQAAPEAIRETREATHTSASNQPMSQAPLNNVMKTQRNGAPAQSSTSVMQSTHSVQRSLPPPERHREALLSLFGTSNSPSPWASKPESPANVVSPLSASQMFSPSADRPMFAVEPISTRSRVGSMVSAGDITPTASYTALPSIKRQTTADDKAFLLGYLGKLASQET